MSYRQRRRHALTCQEIPGPRAPARSTPGFALGAAAGVEVADRDADFACADGHGAVEGNLDAMAEGFIVLQRSEPQLRWDNLSDFGLPLGWC